MNWVDVVLVVNLVVCVITGFAKGFVRVGLGFIATVLAFLIASWMYGAAAVWFDPYVHAHTLANLLGFLTVFILVMIAGALVTFVVAKALHMVGLGMLDRFGGALLGVVRAFVISVVFIMALLAFTRPPHKAVVESQLAPYLTGPARYASQLTPFEINDGVRRAYYEVQHLLNKVVKKSEKETRSKEL